MASPISTSTGLGSGLAISDIVTALVNADKSAKQTQITTQTTLVTTKLSGIGTLKSAMTAFQTALTNLGKTDTPSFAGFAATASDATKLTVTSDNTAVAGTYSVNVTKLATSSSVASGSFTDGASSVIPSGGNLTLTQNGINTSITIADGASLSDVVKQVNATTSTSNISASIITDDNGSRLVFNSTVTGKGNDITATSDVSQFNITAGTKLDPDDASSAGYITAVASDASLTINGLTVTSASNTIDKSLGGVSMKLLATGASTITVATNTDGLKTSLQSFVDAYNTVVKAVTSVTKATISDTADATTGSTVTPAALTGDSMPRAILSALRKELVTTGADGNLSVLSQLGITTSQTDGTLSLDSTKFNTAMTTQGLAGDVQQLFSGTGDGSNGLLARMSAAITPYTQTGGIFDTRTSSLNKQQSDLTDEQTALDLRVTNLTATLTAKYNAMDLIVAQLKASATSITSFFDSLNAQQSS